MTCPELRDCQIDLLARARASLQEVQRLLVEAECGFGKSVCAAEMCRLAVAKGKNVLFLAHRRKLVSQMGVKHLEAFGVPYGGIMADLDQLPYRPDAPVQVASRDTLLSRSVRKGWKGLELPPADLLIVDECHLVLGPEYLDLVRRYPKAKVVGFTATPARSDGKGLGDYFDAMVCAMPTSQLIKEGWILPVRCYAPEKEKGQKKGVVGNPVAEWLKHGAGKPTLLFASKVAQSIAARDAFLAAGIPAEHVDDQTPDREREAVVARAMAGVTKIVCNVGIMGEGVDYPALECVILLRRCSSIVLFKQICGRVMRPSPETGKKFGVIIDHGGAVFRHGFPDEDVAWELTTSETVDQRQKDRRERDGTVEPISCPRCGLLYRPAAMCPACGNVIQKKKPKGEKGASEDGLLFEVPRGQQEAARREEMLRFWKRCLGVMAGKGQRVSAASAMFRSKWGCWPDGVVPDAPAPHQRQMSVADLYPQYVR